MTVTARGPAGGDRPERPAVSNIVRDTTVYGNVIQVGNVADLPLASCRRRRRYLASFRRPHRRSPVATRNCLGCWRCSIPPRGRM